MVDTVSENTKIVTQSLCIHLFIGLLSLLILQSDNRGYNSKHLQVIKITVSDRLYALYNFPVEQRYAAALSVYIQEKIER